MALPIPPLIVTFILCPFTQKVRPSITSLILSQIFLALSIDVSGKIIANSSPPYLAAISLALTINITISVL